VDRTPPETPTLEDLRRECYELNGLPPPTPDGPAHKPYRVTRYKNHWYWGFPLPSTYKEAHFRWYWQANAASFVWHYLFGYSCNTWKRKAGTETARVQEPAVVGETEKTNPTDRRTRP